MKKFTPAKELYEKRYVVSHTLDCIICGSEFRPAHQRRWSQLYCSQKCRSAGNYLERLTGRKFDRFSFSWTVREAKKEAKKIRIAKRDKRRSEKRSEKCKQ